MTTTWEEIRDDLDAIADSVLGAPYSAIRTSIKAGMWTVIGKAVAHYAAAAAIVIRKNGSVVATRGQVNLIEGTNITLTIVDNDPMVDVTIDAAGGGISDGDKGDVAVSSSGTVWTIDNNAVTNAKFRAGAATSVVGRSAGTGGNVADIAASSDGDVLRMSGGTLGFGSIPESSVTGLVSDLAGLSSDIGTVSSALGSLSASLGDLAYISDGDHGDISVSSSGATFTIDAQAVTFAKIANIATARVLGRTSGGSGSIEELTASDTKTLLSLNNVENTALSTWAGSTNITTLGTIGTGVWNATAIADGKIASALTGKTYNGVTLTGASSPSLAVTGASSVSGSNTGDQTITLTGDVTGTGTGSFATTIGAKKVQDSMLRDSTPLSVIGRSFNSTGQPGDIIAAVNSNAVLVEDGAGQLTFATVQTAGLTDAAVTWPKMAMRHSLPAMTLGLGGAESMVVARYARIPDGTTFKIANGSTLEIR